MSVANKNVSVGARILAVDDDEALLLVLAAAFRDEGFLVETATRAKAGLEKYASWRPDIVLLDVALPDGNGFEICHQLKQQYGDACAPVIFITGNTHANDVVRGLASGGTDYLRKPFIAKEALARIELHLQARRLAEQQRKLVTELTAANTLKHKLLGIAAHDLRNSLAAIRSLAEFLQDEGTGPLNDEQRDLVETIHSASQSTLGQINELLDTSWLESGPMKLDRRAASPHALVEKEIEIATRAAAKKEIRFELQPGPFPDSLMVDPEKFRQVLNNLLSNAAKYSPLKSVVTISTATKPGAWTLSVRDQGQGIPEKEIGTLFTAFGKTSARPTGGEKSVGLGLAICRKIMEAHSGSISAENAPDGGSIFKVTFPVS